MSVILCPVRQRMTFICLISVILTRPLGYHISPVPSILGSPGRCAPCQPSSLQLPLYWTLLADVPHVPSSLQFPQSWVHFAAVPMSAQQPSVPPQFVSLLVLVCPFTSALLVQVLWTLEGLLVSCCFKGKHGIASGTIDWIEKMADWQ